ncbi:hypothetical protein Acy02nite_70240 [Actinoplanes cyaneus]|uniref:Uncharacterized protein n=1 Tax=Actinoplanes cyaneus TaxID=52696 RepID=A0A919M970_9ACTN|nr:hypothetical protein [Actinoplanes cyaneus]MCW2140890.1 hypothetical protein [Actinoplanes cyaneus]GID69143.1 hypothetical protein Acy02nite_70240 [Actinoplanes cyaneus]
MTDLERHYARLVRWFYPAGPRQAEIVGTYLEFAAPGRRRPAFADVTDLAAGGLRERVRATGLEAGARLAGVLSLIMLTALATGWFVVEVTTPTTVYCPGFGPFLSPGGVVWTAWLLAAVTHVLSPGRWTRHAIGAALLFTAAVVPVAALLGQYRPPLFVLLPQFALGVVALAATVPAPIGAVPGPRRLSSSSLWVRLLPIAAGVAPVLGWLVPAGYLNQPADTPGADYRWAAPVLLPTAGAVLLIAALLLAIGLAVREDYRGGWTLLALGAPIGMLLLDTIARNVTSVAAGAPNATYAALAGSALVIAIVAPALLLLALTLRRRSPVTRCDACGARVSRPERTRPGR